MYRGGYTSDPSSVLLAPTAKLICLDEISIYRLDNGLFAEQWCLTEQARAIAEAGFALDPGFTIRRCRINAKGSNPAYLERRQRFFEGLRPAGVPEG